MQKITDIEDYIAKKALLSTITTDGVTITGNGSEAEPLAIVSESQVNHPSHTYKVLLTQSGTNGLGQTILVRTFDNSVTWTRTGVGTYLGTCEGAFTNACAISAAINGAPSLVSIQCSNPTIDTIQIITSDINGPADSLLLKTLITVEIYPFAMNVLATGGGGGFDA